MTGAPEHSVTIRSAGQHDTAAITALVVDDRHRRRGIAYALLHTIEESAVDHGCFRLEVTTQSDRADALAFYIAAGFDERPRRLIKLLADSHPIIEFRDL